MKNKYNFTARAAVPALALTAAFAFTANGFAYSTAASAVPGAGSTVGSDGVLPQSIWYNGDLNHVNGLANERDSSLGIGQYAHVFDDFIVPTDQVWNVFGVYSNNYDSMTGYTGVEWSIRQGITAGNGGTLIASGTNTGNDFQVIFHNAGDFGYTEYTVNAINLNITLTAGTYFLNVTPIGSGTGRSFTSDTSGAGCIGNPCGNNGNAFFDSNFFGANYQPTGDQGQPGDFSMGVQVNFVPEPPPWAMMAMGAVVLIGVQQLSRRKKT
jgi:hypothetical protein